MKKRVISGLAALALVLSGGGCLNAVQTVVGNVAGSGFDIAASAVTYKTNSDYEYYVENGGIVIKDYISDATDVIIPSEIDGLPVVKLGESSFYRKDIDSVVIPGTVEIIGDSAFAGCTALSSVTLNEGLVTIGYIAFFNCEKLKTLFVPRSVKNILSGAIGHYGVRYNSNSWSNNGVYDDFTIYCYRNSQARLYAVDNKLKYEIITGITKVNPAVTATVGTTTTDLEWEAVSGAQKYAVCGYTNGAWKTLAETSDTSYTLKGLSAGTGYKIAVIAMFDSAWYEDYSKAVSFTTNAAPVTAAYPEIVGIVKNKQYHQFRIEWEPVKGAQKYGIAVFLANKWKVINQDIPASVTTFTSPKLKEGSTYRLVICAKVNGSWDTSKIEKRAVSITVS